MPPNVKPSQLHGWATGPDAVIIEPLTGKKLQGWLAGEPPPAAYWNWIERLNHQWCAYLQTFEQNAFVWPLKQTFILGADLGAKLTVSAGGFEVTGDSSVAGNLGITGDVTVGGTFGAAGNSTVGGTLGVAGALTVASGGAAVTGNSTVTGTLGVTGAVSGASLNVGAGAVSAGPVSGTTGAFSGNVTAGGTLGVTSTATVGGALTVSSGGATVTGNSTVAGTLGVTGNLTAPGVIGVAGEFYVTGNMRSTGEVQGTTGLFSGTVTAPTFAGNVSTEAPTFLTTLLNSWTTAASTSYYYKDRNDRLWVYLEIEDGVDVTDVFVLPVGYRPTRAQFIVANQLHSDGTELAMILVNTSGAVRVTRLGTRPVPGGGELIIVNGSVRLS